MSTDCKHCGARGHHSDEIVEDPCTAYREYGLQCALPAGHASEHKQVTA